MKYLKKLKFSIAFISISGIINAQNLTLHCGLNYSNIQLTNEYDDVNVDYVFPEYLNFFGGEFQELKKDFGFNIGATFETKRTNSLSLQTGIFFTSKGFKSSYKIGGDTIPFNFTTTSTVNLNYISVPINLKYTYEAKKVKVYGITGPTISLGALMHMHELWKIDNETQPMNVFTLFSEMGLRPVELAWNIGTGIELNKMTYGINYNQGLSNIDMNGDFLGGITNRSLQISVGRRLSKK